MTTGEKTVETGSREEEGLEEGGVEGGAVSAERTPVVGDDVEASDPVMDGEEDGREDDEEEATAD